MINNPARATGLNKSSAFTIQTPPLSVTIMYKRVFGSSFFLCSFLLFCSLHIYPAAWQLRILALRISNPHCFFAGSGGDSAFPRLRRFAPCWLPIPLPVIGPFPWGPVPSFPGIDTLLVPVLAPYSLICA